jgi:hypothetical protein
MGVSRIGAILFQEFLKKKKIPMIKIKADEGSNHTLDTGQRPYFSIISRFLPPFSSVFEGRTQTMARWLCLRQGGFEIFHAIGMEKGASLPP